MRNFFPAKVLLFGEHRVLRGARALAVPLHTKGVNWTLKPNEPDARLLEFVAYLGKHFALTDLRLHELKTDILAGWQLPGNVPFGYGLGSSGTVCAAICFRYGTPKTLKQLPAKLRELLAKMEGHFHGKSSGTDPLISFQNKAALLQDKTIEWPNLPERWKDHFFLLDTGIARTSGPLITRFLERYDTDRHWQKMVNEGWGVADDSCINALLTGDFTRLETMFKQLNEQQISLIPQFIPSIIQPIWRGKSYELKLCGAGGGGYMLGRTSNILQTKEELKEWELLVFETST